MSAAGVHQSDFSLWLAMQGPHVLCGTSLWSVCTCPAFQAPQLPTYVVCQAVCAPLSPTGPQLVILPPFHSGHLRFHSHWCSQGDSSPHAAQVCSSLQGHGGQREPSPQASAHAALHRQHPQASEQPWQQQGQQRGPRAQQQGGAGQSSGRGSTIGRLIAAAQTVDDLEQLHLLHSAQLTPVHVTAILCKVTPPLPAHMSYSTHTCSMHTTTHCHIHQFCFTDNAAPPALTHSPVPHSLTHTVMTHSQCCPPCNSGCQGQGSVALQGTHPAQQSHALRATAHAAG